VNFVLVVVHLHKTHKMPKFLRITSDLHFEFRAKFNTPYFASDTSKACAKLIPPDEKDKDSILVLAGDTTCYKDQFQILLPILAERFEQVVVIPGNHEHYGSSLDNWESWQEQVSIPGITIVSCREALTIPLTEKVNLIAATLWTSCERVPLFSGFNDFNQIRDHSVERCVDLFNHASSEIEKLLIENGRNGVTSLVATHHLPSFSLCDPRYTPSLLDGFYASNLNHLLSGENAPKLWVHGHSHAIQDCRMGDSWILCNPSGYPNELKYKKGRHKVFWDIELGEVWQPKDLTSAID